MCDHAERDRDVLNPLNDDVEVGAGDGPPNEYLPQNDV